MLRCSQWCGLLRLSFVFITIGGSLDLNARTFCRMIDDRWGQKRTYRNVFKVVLEEPIGGCRAASTNTKSVFAKKWPKIANF